MTDNKNVCGQPGCDVVPRFGAFCHKHKSAATLTRLEALEEQVGQLAQGLAWVQEFLKAAFPNGVDDDRKRRRKLPSLPTVPGDESR